MKIETTTFLGRKAWKLDNDEVSLIMTTGGGHIASLTLRDKPGLNPLWVPTWKSIEPWTYNPKQHKKKYGTKLLASILGHNLCLGWFGDPSDEEVKQGQGCHGEAPVARWNLIRKTTSMNRVSLTCGCRLPTAQMEFARTISAQKESNILDVTEKIKNLSKRDLPFTMCEHVTVAPPFLAKDITIFDMPATKCHTFPGKFGDPQRLKPDTSFVWPQGPGVNRTIVDMRRIAAKHKQSADFSTQLMNPRHDDAWFSAINPKQGLLLAYVWKRTDFPWLGNWEENFARKQAPWNSKSLTRGMEFSNSPFPIGLRKSVSLGKFQGQPTYRWLPAGETVTVQYSIILSPVPADTQGVHQIKRTPRGFAMDLVRSAAK